MLKCLELVCCLKLWVKQVLFIAPLHVRHVRTWSYFWSVIRARTIRVYICKLDTYKISSCGVASNVRDVCRLCTIATSGTCGEDSRQEKQHLGSSYSCFCRYGLHMPFPTGSFLLHGCRQIWRTYIVNSRPEYWPGMSKEWWRGCTDEWSDAKPMFSGSKRVHKGLRSPFLRCNHHEYATRKKHSSWSAHFLPTWVIQNIFICCVVHLVQGIFRALVYYYYA